MFAEYVVGPVVASGLTVFFCAARVIFRFAEKLVKVESICVPLESLSVTVFDSSIPLKEYFIGTIFRIILSATLTSYIFYNLV